MRYRPTSHQTVHNHSEAHDGSFSTGRFLGFPILHKYYRFLKFHRFRIFLINDSIDSRIDIDVYAYEDIFSQLVETLLMVVCCQTYTDAGISTSLHTRA